MVTLPEIPPSVCTHTLSHTHPYVSNECDAPCSFLFQLTLLLSSVMADNTKYTTANPDTIVLCLLSAYLLCLLTLFSLPLLFQKETETVSKECPGKAAGPQFQFPR